MNKAGAAKTRSSRNQSSKDQASGPKRTDARRTGPKTKKAKALKGSALDGVGVAAPAGGERLSRAEPPVRRPVGQRLWDMPYSATAPRLIRPELGLHNLVTRAGHNAGYTIDVTLLDAPDHRLIRSGVLLAHRVLDGRGEWYLSGADWQPMLPEEQVEPMGHSDLPEEFADLIRPFRRRATLGPVAALTCERREFALRDDHGTTMALLRDDKVTVRRGGLTTARYREVMLTPVEDGLTEEQAAHVASALANAGATPVARFPRLVTRLGAPATGLTDFPAPQQPVGELPLALFVSNLLATRLRQLVCADLALRSGRSEGTGDVAITASALRQELRGLSPVLDEGWLEDLDEELEWMTGQPGGDLRSKVRSDRYLTLLDRLVTAARGPRVGGSAGLSAVGVLGKLLDSAQLVVVRAAGQLSVESPPQAWQSAHSAVGDLLRGSELADQLLSERGEALRRYLRTPHFRLGEVVRHQQEAQRSLEQAAGVPAQQAFELGRAYEREQAATQAAREAFVHQWGKTAKKLQ